MRQWLNTETQRHKGTEKTILDSLWLCAPVVTILSQKDYRSLSVVSANRANTREAIQKRTMIFDSDQPISSK